MKWDVIILGAGAAGLMCAITAGGRGRHVLVLERSNKVGKKILMSGGGRCNFTNRTVTPLHYISHNPHYCTSALHRYTPGDFIRLVEKHHIAYHEKKHGQLFCNNKASDIVAMLLQECKDAGVTIITACNTTAVQNTFELTTNQGPFTASSLVVATGALSIPSLGGSDYGYTLATHYGLPVLPQRAGLVPFIFTDSFKEISEHLSGISIPSIVSNNKASFTEDMLFTHRGLSGPAILQLSNYWEPTQTISVNLLPEHQAYAFLKLAKDTEGKSLLRNILMQVLPKQLVLVLENLWWKPFSETKLAQIPDNALINIAKHLSAWTLKPAGTEGYRTAEVTLGGVDTRYLSSKTMAALSHPHLYFIGEVVDVTGHLGGFNFQWAWASGFAAGQVC